MSSRKTRAPVGGTDQYSHVWAVLAVPGSLWAYGGLRGLSFAAPLLTSTGGIGLGVVVVAGLWLLVLQARVWAWTILVGVDVVSVGLLWAALFTVDGAAPLAPVLATAALICLIVPSTRRFAGPSRDSADETE